MAQQKCPYCGAELAPEMLEQKMCFACGEMFEDVSEEGLANLKENISLMRIEEEKLKAEEEQIRIKHRAQQEEFQKKYEEQKINRQIELQEQYRKRLKNFKITTGFNFEGYRIVDYLGVVSADVVAGTGVVSELLAGFTDTFGKRSGSFEGKLSRARQAVLNEMKLKALNNAHANAIIGIDLDIVTFSNDMIGVSGLGTAVEIEPIDG
ncbi:YbjQ family protein [Anaerotignum sp.]